MEIIAWAFGAWSRSFGMLVAAVVSFRCVREMLSECDWVLGQLGWTCSKQIIFSYKAAVDHFTMVILTAANFMMVEFKMSNLAASIHLRWTGDLTITPASAFHLSL